MDEGEVSFFTDIIFPVSSYRATNTGEAADTSPDTAAAASSRTTDIISPVSGSLRKAGALP